MYSCPLNILTGGSVKRFPSNQLTPNGFPSHNNPRSSRITAVTWLLIKPSFDEYALNGKSCAVALLKQRARIKKYFRYCNIILLKFKKDYGNQSVVNSCGA